MSILRRLRDFRGDSRFATWATEFNSCGPRRDHGKLTTWQREVFVAITLNNVPIDVLAERLNTTRGALYKTLHDARRKLRAHFAERGLVDDNPEER